MHQENNVIRANMQQASDPSSLFDRVVILSVSFSKFGLTRTVSTQTEGVDVNADPTLVRISKTILDAPEFKRIEQHDRETVAFIKKWSVPCQILKHGMYMLKVDRMETVYRDLEERLIERQQLVDSACQAYEQVWKWLTLQEKYEEAPDNALAKMPSRLKELHDAGDYPTVEKLRGAYDVEVQWVTLNVPWRMERVDRSIYKKEMQRLHEKVSSVMEDGLMLVKEEFRKILDHMIERLTPGPDGKEKILKSPSLKNLQGFIETFSARNICDDAELDSLVNQMRNLTEGVNVKDLKKNTSLRENVRTRFEDARAILDTMIADAPARRIMIPESKKAAVNQ
jgi:hypothetical protein